MALISGDPYGLLLAQRHPPIIKQDACPRTPKIRLLSFGLTLPVVTGWLPVTQSEWDDKLHGEIVMDIKGAAGSQKNGHGRQIRIAIEPQPPVPNRLNVISTRARERFGGGHWGVYGIDSSFTLGP